MTNVSTTFFLKFVFMGRANNDLLTPFIIICAVTFQKVLILRTLKFRILKILMFSLALYP